jgi:hypothetical protein
MLYVVAEPESMMYCVLALAGLAATMVMAKPLVSTAVAVAATRL